MWTSSSYERRYQEYKPASEREEAAHQDVLVKQGEIEGQEKNTLP